jgi:hypothetical protein
MRNTIAKASKVLTGVIMVLAVTLTAILMLNSDNNMAKDMVGAFKKVGTTLDIFYYATYIIIGLAGLLVVVFAAFSIFTRPKAAKNGLIGVGILAVIIILSFLLSTSKIDPVFVNKIADTVKVTPALSKQVGAGLIATYILGALSIVAIIYTAITKFIKG